MRHELSTFKKGSLTTDQYFAIILKKAGEIRDVGIEIEDEELALFSLDGLDSSYDVFVTAITTSFDDLSFSEFKGLLKAHEKRTDVKSKGRVFR